MNVETLTKILNDVASGNTNVHDAVSKLSSLDFEDIDYAHIDHHRSLRKGFPEVIFGQGKTLEQILGILTRMQAQENAILVTRLHGEKADGLLKTFPEAEYDPEARMLVLKKADIPIVGRGKIVVLTAGTSDIPVAKEAAITARTMGNQVETVFDVGVAGIHRLFAHRSAIETASVLIVVAGMEGALPSVVAGMASLPGHRRTDQCRIRCQFRGHHGLVRHVEFMQFKCRRCQYRQWFRGRHHGCGNQPGPLKTNDTHFGIISPFLLSTIHLHRQKMQEVRSMIDTELKTIVYGAKKENLDPAFIQNLESMKFRVFIVESGPELVRQTALRIPDAVIIEVDVPKLNGYQSARLLRNDRSTRNIPIFHIAESATPIDQYWSRFCGGEALFSKPDAAFEFKIAMDELFHRPLPGKHRLLRENMLAELDDLALAGLANGLWKEICSMPTF